MRNHFLSHVALFPLLVGLFSPVALAKTPVSAVKPAQFTQVTAWNFDFDDNIAFDHRAQIMLWNEVEKKEVGVTTEQWATVREKIGKEAPWLGFRLREDGLRYFGDETNEGTERFANDVRETLKLGKDKWKRGSWKAFVKALSQEKTAKWTTIITARMHAPESILKGLKILQNAGHIKYLPPVENIYPVGYPQLDPELRGPATSPSEAKANVMKRILDKEEKIPVPDDATLVTDAAGTGKAKLHLWGFSDDDYGNYTKAVEVLSGEVKKGRWPHVKLVIFYTGTAEAGITPHSVVLTPDGKTRPTQAEEAVFVGN